jgi:hypothetical protein
MKKSAFLAIGVGGLIAGTLDITQAMILFGKKVPLVIAAGLLGESAIPSGGGGTYTLGLLLHFFIAFSVATIYYIASRRLRFLTEHWLICGLFYGAAVDQVMTLVVLPLSALQAQGPFKLYDLVLGIVVHAIVIGLPISFSVRRFSS